MQNEHVLLLRFEIFIGMVYPDKMATGQLKKKETINCSGKLIEFNKPKIMGILNITPDSFYDGGKYTSIDRIKLQIEKLLNQGADLIDIGAYSSRPGARHISFNEEMERLEPVLGLILKHFPDSIISVDTFRAKIAEIAVNDFNVSIINDISAGNLDKDMFETIAKLQVPYIMMHMKGDPGNMQDNPVYEHVLEEIIHFFTKKMRVLKEYGIHDIMIDPGFGFGKTIEHNYELLRDLHEFNIFGLPIVAGFSRKSMIYKFLGIHPDEALNGTTVLNTIALSKGIDILRVHDVLEARQAIELYQKMNDPHEK